MKTSLPVKGFKVERFPLLVPPIPYPMPTVGRSNTAFTIPGGRHAMHHAGLMQKAGAPRVLRAAAAAATAPVEAKIFARIVLRNLEHHQLEASA
ncbi:hypothetical protein BHE74_00030790 [Ensete ventricosum]|uniref:Uncharacterized protein n=1 Tax=Ensete ventricosum TaxID=4639 RepID=A0A427AZE8_ENSVE|nr:hypothetical protein B296_00002913 [Ensete ventricosum]RWW62102.1 hypothetical protein BHE74_00030790 [Ensete ventricosum]RZS08302.1 hypothetical protein BHM03_00039250 [Ensete ventricosum]